MLHSSVWRQPHSSTHFICKGLKMEIKKVELAEDLKKAYRDAEHATAEAVAQPMELTAEQLKEVFGGRAAVMER